MKRRVYEYIPLPELRRMYKRRRRIRKMAMEFAVTVMVSAPYGIMMGLMLMGLWITL